MEDEYLVSLIKRDLIFYNDLLNRISAIRSLDRFLKPSNTSRISGYDELEEMRSFLLHNKYFFDEYLFTRCFSVIKEVGNNLLNNYSTPTKEEIVAFEILLFELIKSKIKDLQATLEDLNSKTHIRDN